MPRALAGQSGGLDRLRGHPAPVFGACLLFGLMCIASSVRADDAFAVLKADLKAHGASDITEVARAFLFEGDARVYESRLEHDGCVGFLALGLGEVQDVDLSLHTRAGQAIAEDTSVAPYAYVRACVAGDVPLYASAQLFAGRGELVILRMTNAPRELGRISSDLDLAVTPGGRLEGLRSVGNAREESPIDGPMLREDRALSELGYVATGPVVPMLLRGGVGLGSLPVQAGGCYRVLVLVPFARGVAITVEAPDGRLWEAHDSASDRATVFVCPGDQEGELRARVESRMLRSLALVRAYQHPEVDMSEVRALGDARALGTAEARFFARSRGLRLTHVGEGWVEGAVPLAWPITLQTGECYGVWALGERGLASVDVRLTDSTGVLVARTEGPPHGASLFHCATSTGVHRLMLRPRGENGIVSVWLGRPVKSRD
jgi:hypothetical protein